MWRASAFVMIAAPLVHAFPFAMEVFWEWDRSFRSSSVVELDDGKAAPHISLPVRVWESVLSSFVSMTFVVSVGLASICWAAYPFARLYVLVECFAGLRVERDVYRTVEWANFIPHAG
ncbi:hypothetical protein BDV95DRAFT_351257 [Massariosphaeria phaeospora]|uniref:Etoposide-induced protein 2.4-domain-containing protein n=1 Tax=Massariosphaeria phaeospora TaxID=100035 RepID=A0A7C8I909_9PLEO|nr:hypothetical protein BDV95DRAFT_351257 [Massariosphaeria phaeospora]